MIQMQQISNQYDGVQILKGLNFSMREGEFVVLYGADDTGKTTLLHILMGFNTSYNGRVSLLGSRPNNLGRIQRKQVRFIPDNLIMDRHITGEDYLLSARDAVDGYDVFLQGKLCEEFEIPVREKLVNMSHQKNKMVQVIGAVCAAPKLLILDEPFNFLEDKVGGMLLDHMAEWNSRGMGILLVVERLEEAGGLGSRRVHMEDGKLFEERKPLTPNMRNKLVAVVGGDKKVLNQYMARCINQSGDRAVYLFRGDLRQLSAALYAAACEDWIVQDLPARRK